MRWRLIVAVSVGLNVVLGMVLWSLGHQPPPRPPTGLQAATTNKPKTEVVVRKQFFSWREVESPDYAAYIKNLRDIGCPEQTVRDIIIADVNQLYSRKRVDVIDTPEEQWWHTPPDTNFVAAARGKLDALEQERRELLTTLLGTNWDVPIPATTKQYAALNGPVLGELSAETKDKVQQIIGRSQDRVREYLDAQQKAGKKADPADLARFERQMRSELSQVLNSAQMEEFLLRFSQTAINLRNQLKGFEATPEEFRKMFLARDPIEMQLPFITGDPQTVADELAAFQKQEDEAIKNALGTERYAAYLQAKDPAYQAALALGQTNNATPDMVQKLYALNKMVAQERARIQNDPTLSDDDKADQLANLNQQSQSVSDQILGVEPPPPPPPFPPTQQPPPIAAIHTFSPGETVDMIAARYNVPAFSILTANPDLDFNQLRSGAQIKIPKISQ